MHTTQQIVNRYTGNVAPTDRYVVATFTGGNSELARFLNAMSPNWSLVTVQLASVIGSPVALFEIRHHENRPQTTRAARGAKPVAVS